MRRAERQLPQSQPSTHLLSFPTLSGSAFTRLLTLRLSRMWSVLKDKLLSYGPCQFPTLGFIVERVRSLGGEEKTLTHAFILSPLPSSASGSAL